MHTGPVDVDSLLNIGCPNINTPIFIFNAIPMLGHKTVLWRTERPFIVAFNDDTLSSRSTKPLKFLIIWSSCRTPLLLFKIFSSFCVLFFVVKIFLLLIFLSYQTSIWNYGFSQSWMIKLDFMRAIHEKLRSLWTICSSNPLLRIVFLASIGFFVYFLSFGCISGGSSCINFF